MFPQVLSVSPQAAPGTTGAVQEARRRLQTFSLPESCSFTVNHAPALLSKLLSSPLLQAPKKALIEAGACWGDLYLCVFLMSSSQWAPPGLAGGCSEGELQGLMLGKH